MILNSIEQEKYINFLKILNFPKITQVVQVSFHSSNSMPGWQGLKSICCLGEKNEIYEVDIRYAWGKEVFKQNLIDYYSAHFMHLYKNYANHINKLIIYICEESTQLNKEQSSFQVIQSSLTFCPWKTVNHIYLPLQVCQQFIGLLFLDQSKFNSLNQKSYGTLEYLEKYTALDQMQAQKNFIVSYSGIHKQGGLRTKYLIKKYPFQKPLISIITVVLNGKDKLEQTIQSVINQTNHNIEYLIIDGNSTDDTFSIIHKYENEINYWLSELDTGVYHAMNKGWEMAHDDSYVLFLGAGDVIISLPEIEKGSKEIIFGQVIKSDTGLFKSTSDFRLRLGNTIHHQALLIHKSLCLKPPFDLSYKVYADFDFNARLLNQGSKFSFSKEFSSYAAPAGISGKHHIVEVLRIVKKNYGLFWLILAIFYHIYQGFKYGFDRYSINFK